MFVYHYLMKVDKYRNNETPKHSPMRYTCLLPSAYILSSASNNTGTIHKTQHLTPIKDGVTALERSIESI